MYVMVMIPVIFITTLSQVTRRVPHGDSFMGVLFVGIAVKCNGRREPVQGILTMQFWRQVDHLSKVVFLV